MKLLKLGTVALDGTKMHANASRHSALSYGYAEKLQLTLSVSANPAVQEELLHYLEALQAA